MNTETNIDVIRIFFFRCCNFSLHRNNGPTTFLKFEGWYDCGVVGAIKSRSENKRRRFRPSNSCFVRLRNPRAAEMAVNYGNEKEGREGTRGRHLDDWLRHGRPREVPVAYNRELKIPATMLPRRPSPVSQVSVFWEESTPLFAFRWDFPAENENVHQIVNIEMQ